MSSVSLDDAGPNLVWFTVLFTLLVFILVACATTTPPAVVTSVRTVTVEKAVPVPCVDTADVPSETRPAFPSQPADMVRNASAASAELRALVNENRKLRALITPCLILEKK